MAKKIDHNERRREIARKAMYLFSKVGFDNVSLIMIAASAGLSRTVLYRYFCSKREILDAAISEQTDRIRVRTREILGSKATVAEKLERICLAVTDVIFDQTDFLIAVYDFVIGMVRTGVDMNGSIRQFTTGTREVLRLLIERGVARGEFSDRIDVARTADSFYAAFESATMRIVLGTEKTPDALKARFSDMVKAISR